MKNSVNETIDTSIVKLVLANWSKSLEKIKIISEAWQLAEACKASNNSLENEERAAILHDYIIWLWCKIETIKKSTDTLIVGNWVIWYNVSYKWKKVWIFKTFLKDANVIFQAYWDNKIIKEWKLTAQGVMQIEKIVN